MMGKLSHFILVTASLLVAQGMAQSAANPLDVLISVGYSLFTEATSILPSVASAASAAAASSSAAATSTEAATTSSSTSSASPSSSSATSATSSAFQTSGPAVAAASATASSDGLSSSHRGSHNNLAIILGSVLGSLALGLLLLALILCCRRRRHRSRDSVRSQALSPSADEVESWRQPGSLNDHHNANKEVLGSGAAGAPLMSEHPAFRNETRHQNPFVPVPPPPRRSALNSRAGLTDGAVHGDDPYLVDKKTGNPLSSKDLGRKSTDSTHRGGGLALGAGGIALGAAAMHHHDKNKEHNIDNKHSYGHDTPHNRSSMISRKPVPNNPSDIHDPYPYPTPTTNDDPFALNKSRRSMDSSRSRPSRDAARANATFDEEYSSPNNSNHHHAGTAAALGAGALGGAALAHHHHHHRRKSSSNSRSPHRHTILPTHDRNSEHSDSSNDKEYSDALPHQLYNVPTAEPGTMDHPSHAGIQGKDVAAGPHGTSPYDVPPTPQTRSRHNSAFGTAAPFAAAMAYSNHSRSRSRSQSTSTDRGAAAPTVPYRSPHRSSFPHGPDTGSPLPRNNSGYDEPKPIVGDNGYPHMNVPRRKSGGEYDSAQPALLGPQAISPPQGPTVPGSRYPTHMTSSNETSDDSTWRLSQGMPGGWQRSHSPANRYSLDSNRMASPVSPIDQSGGFGGGNERDSLMSGSTAVAGTGGKRLRLADLRRQEEERMGTEWHGDRGDDGYAYHHHGVGQAI